MTAQIGIGLLKVNTTYPLAFYKNEDDVNPVDILRFKINDDGQTMYETRLALKPYRLYEGDSHIQADRQVRSGLVAHSAELILRVLDATNNSFRVITDETTGESLFVKKESDKVYYRSIQDLYENKPISASNSGSNPNWVVYETWEVYLKRVEFITKKNLKIYDKPNGSVIFENSSGDFLPFRITDIAGEWIKLQKGFGREFNFDSSKNYDGWTQWRNDEELLIEITEQTYE